MALRVSYATPLIPPQPNLQLEQQFYSVGWDRGFQILYPGDILETGAVRPELPDWK